MLSIGRLFQILFIIILTFGNTPRAFSGGACVDFTIITFNQSWCQAAPYPTAYATVSFAVIEDFDNIFRKKEISKTFIVDLPAGFEFNTSSITATVANSIGGDISACSFVYNSATQVAVTITTVNAYNNIDSLLFDDFEIRAMGPGNSGYVLRTGGDFRIDGSSDCPGDGAPNPPEPFGYLFAGQPMIYDSSRVNQNTLPIRKTCGLNSEILEIKISVTDDCPTLLTQFFFSTDGDVGFSQNPTTNITTANVYYTGTSQGFSATNLFGSVISPNGSFTVTGSLLLTSSGDHYFYLSYDVPLTSNTGDGLDARLDSFIFDGIAISDMATPNPAGIRTIIDTLCLQPDLPDPSANMQTIPMGSLIIPMDTVNQSILPPFNLKAYGLVHDLLLNDVPVKWIIRSGKARNDTDFTALAERIWPSILPPAVIEFRASAFVIDSSWVNTSYSQWVKSATQVINDFGNDVAVYELKEDKILDVRYELDQRPKIAVFDNGGNQAIHITILNEAGLTPIDTANPLAGGSYVTVGAGLFTGIDECFTFCSEPHWAGTIADSLITDNIRDFVSRGGNFLAQCRGVDTYENFSLQNIVSTKGVDIVNQNVSHLYSNADMAFMQFDGDLIENEGGSERNWILTTNSQWRSGFYYAISDQNIDTVVASGAHIVPPDSVGGNVFYLGGHDYSPFNDLRQINAARLYMNATLIPSGRPTLFTLDPGDTLFSCVGYPVQLGGSPTGPADATYNWSPGTWLDDSLAQNPIATPTDTITYSLIAYRGGCIVGPVEITINASPVPVVDAGLDQNVCGNIASVSLVGSVVNAAGGTWSTTGTGTFNDDTMLTTNYSPTSGDSSSGSILIFLTATGGCDSIIDTLVLIFTTSPTVAAGPDQTTCDTAGVVLTGVVTVATGGTWTTSGTGTFVPSADSLNTIYIPSSADTSLPFVILTLTTTGNGGCNPVSDSLVLDFDPLIAIDAGPDQTICAADGQVNLSGSVTVATGGIWSSNTGGTFIPDDTTLNTTYVFSPADLASGIVVLTLTTTGNGLCNSVSDSLTILIAPAVDAGPDMIVCNNTDTIQLDGTVENALGGVWITSGTGVFLPNDSTIDAQYTITVGDIATGTLIFVLTTTDTGLCPASIDTMILTIIPPSIANAGSDQTVCADTAGVVLSGTFTNASGAVWSASGGGTFLPAPDSLDVTYIPDSAGTDTIVLTTIGSCNNVSDTLFLTITPAPTVDAGPDTSVCATIPNMSLSGNITVATGGVWSTGGTGTFTPNDTDMNVTYIPSNADTAAGSVIIVLSTTGNGDCNVHSDTMIITYTPDMITVDAGTDTVVCNNTSGIQLNGVVTIATGGTWSTTGDGTFSPDADSLNAVYIPGSTDTLSGSVTLILTTIGNGGCNSKTDSLTIGFFSAPIVFAGSDTIVCYTTDTIFLNGSVTNAGGAVWSSTGTGTFFPGDSSINAAYIPSPGDILNGGVTLTLLTYESCNNMSDTMEIEIVPSVNAGPDQIICNDVDTVYINGVVTGVAGGIWSTSGTGTFIPSDTTLSAGYVMSSGDSAAGTIILTLTTTGNLMGCPPATDILIITVLPPPTVYAGSDQDVCANEDSVYLNGSVSNAGGVWTSSSDGTFSPDSVTLNAVYILSPADTVAGTVTLTLTTTGSCMILSDSLTITITPPPVADFSFSDVCLYQTTGFSDATPGNIVTWLWDFGDGDMDSIQNPQHLYDSAGSYMVSLIVIANNSCIDTITKLVLVHPFPIADFGFNDICEIDTIYFTDSSTVDSPDDIIAWTWYFGDGNSDTVQNPSHDYSTYGFYQVVLIVETNEGCRDTLEQMVVVSPAPTAQFAVDNNIVSTEDDVNFTDQSTGTPAVPDTVPIVDWQWDFYYPASGSGDSTALTQNPYHNYTDTGRFTVQLIVTNEYGCTDTIYDEILVELNPIVPSGFTPDGNGENDILYVVGGPYNMLEFIIYNEWGEVIFVSNSQEDGWDGTFKGVKQPMGVYVYTVVAETIDGKDHQLWGDVTLLR